MTLREKQAKFWTMVGMLLVKAAKDGTPLVVLEWIRTLQQQQVNVAKGASKTLKSAHLEGLAVDIAFLSDIRDDGKINYSPDKYKAIGEYWESIGGEWGGRYGDDPNTEKIEGWDAGHFRLKDWEK